GSNTSGMHTITRQSSEPRPPRKRRDGQPRLFYVNDNHYYIRIKHSWTVTASGTGGRGTGRVTTASPFWTWPNSTRRQRVDCEPLTHPFTEFPNAGAIS